VTAAKARVLIVEDDEHIAEGLRFNLEAEGLEAVVAQDGARAAELLTDPAEQFALVILDLRLPEMSGFEVARRTRAELLEMGEPRGLPSGPARRLAEALPKREPAARGLGHLFCFRAFRPRRWMTRGTSSSKRSVVRRARLPTSRARRLTDDSCTLRHLFSHGRGAFSARARSFTAPMARFRSGAIALVSGCPFDVKSLLKSTAHDQPS